MGVVLVAGRRRGFGLGGWWRSGWHGGDRLSDLSATRAVDMNGGRWNGATRPRLLI